MQHCAFCESEFPDDAHFCGRCGRAPIATLDAPTTLSSGLGRPVPKKEAEEEEERRRRAFLLDLSFSPGGGGQPGAGHVPVVQGTPQVSGVPMTQGTPTSLGGAPAVSAVSSSAAPPAPSPLGPPQASQGGAPVAPTASSAPPKLMGSPHPPQEPPYHGRQVQHQPEKLHAPRSGRPASARGIRSVPKGLHIALAGLVVLAASGITLALIHKGGGGTPSRPGTIIEFSLPTVGSDPEGITAGPDGNLWFTEYSGNKIGRITPGGKVTGFSAPNPLIQSGGPFVRRTPAW
jgi:hypothetical protein